MWGKIAWRLFWRELSRGELWVIAFSLFLAVLTVVSLSGITESVRSALYQRSANFVAADKILRSSVGFNEQVQQSADDLQLKSSRQVQFNSMLFAKDLMQLVSVKAVSAAYPLRGELKLSSSLSDDSLVASLQPNQLYLENRLYSLLNIKVGDSIELGEKVFTAAGVIVAEPDAPLSVFGSSPRVLMHLDDVAATGIIQPGSRINYRLMFAGSQQDLELLETQTKEALGPQDRWQKMDRESAIGGALDRSERFLLLSGLLGIVLAACAAAVAANRYSQRHARSVAVMKALGATTTLSRKIYGSHLLFVVIFSVGFGLVAGQLLVQLSQWGVAFWMPEYLAEFSFRPLGLGVLTAAICAVLFSARPLWRLAAVPALNVLREKPDQLKFDPVHLISGSVAIWLLMWLFSGDLWISSWLFVLCLVFAALLMGFAAVLVLVSLSWLHQQSSHHSPPVPGH